MAVQPIPPGYHTVTPYLMMKDASKAIRYYQQAFGATELFRMPGPNDAVMHAELQIGTSRIMLADESAGEGCSGPTGAAGTPVSLMVYVEDVDKVFARAIESGGTVKRPVIDQFYGDRSGTLADPFGHVWTIATHKEDLSHEELERRLAAMMKTAGGGA